MTGSLPLPGFDVPASVPSAEAPPVKRAFGVENRARLLNQYFSEAGDVDAKNAWQHVYRLLLSIDQTIGLAHCYESDKCQPGRPWYERSLRFHDRISRSFDVPPKDVALHIDWLFTQASVDLAAVIASQDQPSKVQAQRAPYADRDFPLPGEDPELVSVVLDVLKDYLTGDVPEEVAQNLVRRVQSHLSKENKRKNMVGEGFEDTLAAVLHRVPSIASRYEISTRKNLHDLPGFNASTGTKTRQVDLALVRHADQYRILITAKWSIRSDREEQFPSDFNDYVRLESTSKDFAYVLITNEFDAARLVAACDARRQNAPLFNNVVHVDAGAPVEAYGPQAKHSATKLRERVSSGRLQSLAQWINEL
ncbi:hypothetical protein WIS52_14900 [Pseudonocardia nematodicida]|uniref:Restriction endonuclease n=1 Tax=Pseudonocardia nematodicida TaxID=1206997 RepID=A0ABV1KBA1_9PSEU